MTDTMKVARFHAPGDDERAELPECRVQLGRVEEELGVVAGATAM